MLNVDLRASSLHPTHPRPRLGFEVGGVPHVNAPHGSSLGLTRSLTHDHAEALVPVGGRAEHAGDLLGGGVDVIRPLEGQPGEGDLQGGEGGGRGQG